MRRDQAVKITGGWYEGKQGRIWHKYLFGLLYTVGHYDEYATFDRMYTSEWVWNLTKIDKLRNKNET